MKLLENRKAITRTKIKDINTII